MFCYSCTSYKEVIKGSYTINVSSAVEGGETIIFGTVVSKEDNEPIPSATISVVNTNKGAITSELGRFSIQITPGHYQLIFSAIGYDDLHLRKLILEDRKNLEINVQLGTTKIYQK